MNSKIDVGVIEYSLGHRGGSLHVLDYPGEDPPIVLMHGFPDDHRIYDKLFRGYPRGGPWPSTGSDTVGPIARIPPDSLLRNMGPNWWPCSTSSA